VSFTEENVSHERIQRSVKGWKTKYPLAAEIFDKIPSMDLEEVVRVMILSEGVRSLLKIHAMNLHC